jgi:hypothetical protein
MCAAPKIGPLGSPVLLRRPCSHTVDHVFSEWGEGGGEGMYYFSRDAEKLANNKDAELIVILKSYSKLQTEQKKALHIHIIKVH